LVRLLSKQDHYDLNGQQFATGSQNSAESKICRNFVEMCPENLPEIC